MKLVWLLMFPVLLFSCKKEVIITGSMPQVVNITTVVVPDSCALLAPLSITATASAPSTCWNNLFFELAKLADPNNYALTAYGIYRADSSCLQETVKKDTTISLKLARKGTYYFYITRSQGEVVLDSTVVR